ncbi:MAG: UbiX family flavin prenyltransferase [Phycisphaerae bacterium]
MTPPNKRIILAITGASGALYAKRLLESLLAANAELFLIISPTGRRLLHDELGIESGGPLDIDALAGTTGGNPKITLLPYKDVGACIASGSFKAHAMVVCPCSNNKLAEFAYGLGDNLISRAAQVTLKERRRLIIVHRETPLGLIEIKNMLALTEAGAIICPANPGFYTLPQSIDDLVNMLVGRILDLLDIPHTLHARWTGKSPAQQQPQTD